MALPDGRLVVSDPHENRLVLIDFPKGTSQPLARLGDGPREFRMAGGLYRGREGRVVMFDQELLRLLPISPSGVVEEVMGVPTSGAYSPSTRGPDGLRIDSLGHTYVANRYWRTAPNSALLGYRSGVRPDTLTELLKRVTKALEGNGYAAGVYQDVLFSPEDAWAVSPDGRVAVVRAEPYRVEWIPLDGPTVSGPAVSHKPVRITQAEKELIASGAGGSRGRMTVTVGMVPAGAIPARPSSAPSPMPVEDLLFAKVKTPVNLRGGRWPVLDERGRLWVERNLPAGAKAGVFDVFDGGGNLVDRIELPLGSRVVGFDSQWVYTARLDPDGFEHLQRFALP